MKPALTEAGAPSRRPKPSAQADRASIRPKPSATHREPPAHVAAPPLTIPKPPTIGVVLGPYEPPTSASEAASSLIGRKELLVAALLLSLLVLNSSLFLLGVARRLRQTRTV
jgi:hypothetical protein